MHNFPNSNQIKWLVYDNKFPTSIIFWIERLKKFFKMLPIENEKIKNLFATKGVPSLVTHCAT